MKFIGYLILPLVLVFLSSGCDDECMNCVQYSPNCIFLENVINSECLAEDLIRTCESYNCRSETFSFSIRRDRCEVIDCTSLTCDVTSGTPTVVHSGTITIEGLEPSNLPFGLVEVDVVDAGNFQEVYDCTEVSP